MCCIHTYTETYKCAYVCHYTTTHTVCISPYLLGTQSWPDTGVLSVPCIQKVTGDQPSAPPHCAFQNRPSTETLDLLIPLWAPAPPVAQLRRVHFHLLSGKSAPPQILEYEETFMAPDNLFMGTPRCHSLSTWKGGRGVEGMGGGTCWVGAASGPHKSLGLRSARNMPDHRDWVGAGKSRRLVPAFSQESLRVHDRPGGPAGHAWQSRARRHLAGPLVCLQGSLWH